MSDSVKTIAERLREKAANWRKLGWVADPEWMETLAAEVEALAEEMRKRGSVTAHGENWHEGVIPWADALARREDGET